VNYMKLVVLMVVVQANNSAEYREEVGLGDHFFYLLNDTSLCILCLVWQRFLIMDGWTGRDKQPIHPLGDSFCHSYSFTAAFHPPRKLQ
jgi:ABC-type uncharacterized transport system permease subunit